MKFEYDPGFYIEKLSPIETRLLEEMSERPSMTTEEFLALPIKEILTDLEVENIHANTAEPNGSSQLMIGKE